MLGLIPYKCTWLSADGLFQTKPWCAGLPGSPAILAAHKLSLVI